MKRFIALTCILLLMLTLSACGLDGIVLRTTYKATCVLYVSVNDSYSINTDVLNQHIRDASTILKSRSVLDRVIEETETALSIEKLQDMISVESPSDTNFITICVTAQDSQLAMDIADALIEIGLEMVNEIMGSNVLRVCKSPTLTTQKPFWNNLFS